MPGNICGGYGTAEAVPLTDRAVVNENMRRLVQKQIPFGNDKQEKQEQQQKAKAAGLALSWIRISSPDSHL